MLFCFLLGLFIYLFVYLFVCLFVKCLKTLCFASLSQNFLLCVPGCSILSCVDVVFIGLINWCVWNKLTPRTVVKAHGRLIRFKQDILILYK